MSKFCTNCGSALEENVKFCTSCGQAVEAEVAPAAPVAEAAPAAVEAPAVETPVEAAPAKSAASFDFKKLLENKKRLAIIGAAVAAVVILILVLSMGGGSGKAYLSQVDAYLDYSIGKASKSQIENLMPEEIWLRVQTSQEKPMAELLDYLMEQQESRAQQFAGKYGTNIKATYTVIRDWTISEERQAQISAYLAQKYGFEEGCVTDAHKLEMEATIKGSVDEEDDSMTAYMLKIGGKWYLARVSFYDYGEIYVSFALGY